MIESDRTLAEHIAHVVRDFQIQQTGQAPKSVNVVLSGDTAVVTLNEALSAAEREQAVTPDGSHLGRVRWVVERTISWIKGLRRMRVRYDRSEVSIDAWTSVAASVVCLRIFMDATT